MQVKIQSSLWHRNPALHRRGVKTSQEHEEGVFQTARNKHTTRILNGKLRVSPSSNTSYSMEKQREQDSCSMPLPPPPCSPVSAPSSPQHPPTAQPCWPGTQARAAMACWTRPWGSLLEARAGLGCLFPDTVSTNSCLSPPLPV